MILSPETIPTIYLKPGELYCAVTPTIVSTVLGSCVSITMHNPELRMSTICHAVLPEELTSGDPCRYVDSSIIAMLRMFDRYGIKKKDLEVKLFGGSDMLPPSNNCFRKMTVGKQNILRSQQIIEREQLNLLAYDVGGTHGRKLYFRTHTGEVFLKRLQTSGADPLMSRKN